MKRSPEEVAKRAAARMAETSRKLAAATVNNAIGEKLLELLAKQDEVSFSDMISAFQTVIDARGARSENDLVVMQAEECINALRALRTSQASTPVEPAEA